MSGKLIEMLKSGFPDPTTQTSAFIECKNKILNHQTNRCFDGFPRVVDDVDLKIFETEFLAMFRQLPEANSLDSDTNNINLTIFNQQKIECWTKKIITHACDHLFSLNTKEIDLLFLRALDLTDYQDKINKADLICAFVGAVSQQMMKEPFFIESIEHNVNNSAIVFTYINQQYRAWTLKIMQHHKIIHNDSEIQPAKPEQIFSTTLASSLVGVGIVGTMFALGYSLFKAYQHANQDDDFRTQFRKS